jgi:hypothetical protein
MMLFLTAGASVQCAHGGRVQVMPSQQQVTAGGSPLLCEPDLEGRPILGCAQPPTPTTKPCTTLVKTLPGSTSLRIRVGGRGIYLSTLSGITDGVPPAPVFATSAGQTSTELGGAP